MLWMFVFLGIALMAAVVVFLFASVVTRVDDRPDGRDEGIGAAGFWRDFRGGLSGWRRRSAQDRAAVRSSRPVDTGMEEFFAAVEVDDPAYMDADEITDVLHRARERASHTWQGATVRRPHSADAAPNPAARPQGTEGD